VTVYNVSDDTLFLISTIQEDTPPGHLVLEIGTGNGLITECLTKMGYSVIGTELLSQALTRTASRFATGVRQNRPFLVLTESAGSFRNTVFDSIIINPPYLPSIKISDIAIDGGVGGIQILENIIRSSINSLVKEGEIRFLLSSLSHCKDLWDNLGGLLHLEEMSRKKLFFEELIAIKARRI